jgi:hypothetical protein
VVIDLLVIFGFLAFGGDDDPNFVAGDAASKDSASSVPLARRGRATGRGAARGRRVATSASERKSWAFEARFLDPAGKPLTNSRIEAHQWPANAVGWDSRPTLVGAIATDARGATGITALDVDLTMPIHFQVNGVGVGATWPENTQDSSGSARLGDIALERTLPFRGIVHYETGELVTRGYVNAFSDTGCIESAAIDERGCFQLNHLSNGNARIWIVDPESEPVEDVVAVFASMPSESAFTIRRGSAISGKLGSRGGEAGQATYIRCVSENGAEAIARARRDGAFFIRGLTPDRLVDVEVFDTASRYLGGARGLDPRSKDIEIPYGTTRYQGKLSVRLVDDETGATIESYSWLRLHRRRAGETIERSESVRRDMTESSGSWSARTVLERPDANTNDGFVFRYGELGPGRFLVSATVSGYLYGETAAVLADGIEDVGPLELRLPKSCSLQGTVRLPGGEFASGAALTLVRTDGPLDPNKKRTMIHTASDAAGSFRFSNLHPGAYELIDGLGESLDPPIRLSLRSNGTVRDLAVTLARRTKPGPR